MLLLFWGKALGFWGKASGSGARLLVSGAMLLVFQDRVSRVLEQSLWFSGAKLMPFRPGQLGPSASSELHCGPAARCVLE